MKNFQINNKGNLIIFLLGFVAFFIADINAERISTNSAMSIEKYTACSFVDGTQLVEETKEFVADYYSVSGSIVSASYVGQTISGAYKYSYSIVGGPSGFVEWTIIGDDYEGMLY